MYCLGVECIEMMEPATLTLMDHHHETMTLMPSTLDV
jgi:hypothetical protein